MISDKILHEELQRTLDQTEFTFGKKYEGKVRDNYTVGDRRVIITTDRISAFDRVLGSIPFKGQVLNALSNFWFEKTKHIVPNHIIEIPDPNVVIVKECEPLPVEMVVRGYITGVTKTSAWYNYQQGVRNFCGNRLPEGLKKDQQFKTPILTPSTKAEKGGHDESVSREEILKRKLMAAEVFDAIAAYSMELYRFGVRLCAKQGIILVDTKYEFGLDASGGVILFDEIHTPDSSRFWHADTYEKLFKGGKEQRKIDKEYVRKWLADIGYLGDGEPPLIPDEVRIEAARRYIDAYEKITGMAFRPALGTDPAVRIEHCLKKAGYIR